MPITVRLGACDPCYLFHDATTATAPFLCPLISSLSFAFGPNTVSISSNRSVGAPLSSATLRKRLCRRNVHRLDRPRHEQFANLKRPGLA